MADVPHNKFMARANELARRAEGRTSPNPMVGCVIVRDGLIVAEGFHTRAGEAHAEVEALKNLKGGPEDCILYVNLEPCSFHGRTPPCADALISAGIRHVVVGVVDPHPRVSGKGIERLRAAGIEVEVGILEGECRELNRPFFTSILEQRPFVAVKYAMTLDGRIATKTGSSAWITNEASRAYVHELRNRYDAIMVGRGTLVADNPRLNCRMANGRDPVRVFLDSRLSGALDSRAFGGDALRLVFTTKDSAGSAKAQALRELGVEVLETPELDAGLDLGFVMSYLTSRNVLSVLVEGGSQVLGSLFDHDWVDYVHAFVAPKIVGGLEAPGPVGGVGVAQMSAALALDDATIRVFGSDVLMEGPIRRGEG